MTAQDVGITVTGEMDRLVRGVFEDGALGLELLDVRQVEAGGMAR